MGIAPKLNSIRGGVRLERTLFDAGPGLVGLRQAFVARGQRERVLVTGDGWILSTGRVDSGRVLIGGQTGERFTMYFPPRSVVRLELEDARFTFEGVASLTPPPCTHDVPVLLEPNALHPRSPAEVAALVKQPVLHRLDPDATASSPVRGARLLLHARRDSTAPLGDAASQVDLSSSALCRAFAAQYGITPKQYVHRARLFEATVRLLGGATVLHSAFESGFGDLSRFYQQFRRLIGATPATYRRAAQEPPRTP
ncbi:MAG: AraC family transcriptional regulator [Myxococcaceae bacterium]